MGGAAERQRSSIARPNTTAAEAATALIRARRRSPFPALRARQSLGRRLQAHVAASRLAVGCIDHPRSRVRAAAVTALARLDMTRAVSTITERLDDSSGVVRRAAVAALADAPRHEWYDRARELAAAGSDRGRVAALHLLALQSGWDTIPVLLEAALSDKPGLADRARQALYDWQRRHGTHGWLKPSTQARIEISAVWPEILAKAAPQRMQGTWSRLKRDIASHVDGRGSNAAQRLPPCRHRPGGSRHRLGRPAGNDRQGEASPSQDADRRRG